MLSNVKITMLVERLMSHEIETTMLIGLRGSTIQTIYRQKRSSNWYEIRASVRNINYWKNKSKLFPGMALEIISSKTENDFYMYWGTNNHMFTRRLSDTSTSSTTSNTIRH